jgi:tetratricopeptide (TPR) repeat protein
MEETPESTQDNKDIRKVRPDPEIRDTLDAVRRYGPAVGTGLLIALIAMVFFVFMQQREISAEDNAMALLYSARDVGQLQLVVDQHADTAAAPLALQALASRHFREGRFDQAQLQYVRFIDSYPAHTMRPAAELGLAYCEEAMGNLDQALTRFQTFAAEHDAHYLAPVARLGAARVLGLQGQTDAARAIYEELQADEDSVWATQAEADLRYLEKEVRAR